MLKLPVLQCDISNSVKGNSLPSSRSATPPQINNRSPANNYRDDTSALPVVLTKSYSTLSENTDGSGTSADSYESPSILSRSLEAGMPNTSGVPLSLRAQQLLQSSTSSTDTNFLLPSKQPGATISPSTGTRTMPATTLAPLVISPYQQPLYSASFSFSRNSSMSPSSIPLKNVKSLEITFPDNVRPYSPGESEEVSSLNLRKKALTPMNILRNMRRTPSPSPSAFQQHSMHRISPKQQGVYPSPLYAASNGSHSSSHYSMVLNNNNNTFAETPTNNSSYWSASSQSDDTVMTDAEVEETVKQAIALALVEEIDENQEENASSYDHKQQEDDTKVPESPLVVDERKQRSPISEIFMSEMI